MENFIRFSILSLSLFLDIHIPADCQDSPVFANCATIVQMNYCSNPRFHEFCCRSCYIAEYSRQKPNGILQSNEIINHDDRQNNQSINEW